MSYDVAIIGAGYVGLPLSTTFAEAGCRVLLVDVVEPVVDALNRGESHIEDVANERLKPLVDQGLDPRDDRLRGAEGRRGDPDRAADAALPPARAGSLDRRGRRARDREGPARGAGRRARVDDVAGHDARGAAADSRGGLRAEGRRRLPSRDVARARRPGPRGLDDEDDAEGARRDHARVHEARCRCLPPRGRHDRRGVDARGGRADEAAREHLPLGQHRARQRARAALRPDVDRRLGGRGRGGDEAVRLHAASARAPASAATASRSTRSI